MSKTYIKATLVDGTEVVGEFTRLRTGYGYMHRIARGEAMNVWKVVSGTHPASGEEVAVRTLDVIPAARIVSLTQVDANGQPVQIVKRGPFGRYQFAEGAAPEGAVTGIDYPVHRDPESLRKYVILDAANGTRFFLDGFGEAGPQPATDDATTVPFAGSVSMVDDDDEDEEESEDA